MTEPLHKVLSTFADKVNRNEKVKTLVSGWNPNIVVDTIEEGGVQYTMQVRDARITDIAAGEIEADHVIRLEGSDETLQAIFNGRSNPASAVLTGDLAIFGEPADHIRLDAISMLIWGD